MRMDVVAGAQGAIAIGLAGGEQRDTRVRAHDGYAQPERRG